MNAALLSGAIQGKYHLSIYYHVLTMVCMQITLADWLEFTFARFTHCHQFTLALMPLPTLYNHCYIHTLSH